MRNDRRETAPRRAATAVLALALAATLAAAADARAGDIAGIRASRDEVRRALAEHRLRTLDGTPHPAARRAGEVVVLNFWASWCTPCRRELPALDALHADIASRGGAVLAISIDADVRNARRFAATHRLALPVLHDGPDGLAKRLDLDRVPVTLVLDRSGEVAYATSGADARALADLRAVVERLVDDRPIVIRAEDGGTR